VPQREERDRPVVAGATPRCDARDLEQHREAHERDREVAAAPHEESAARDRRRRRADHEPPRRSPLAPGIGDRQGKRERGEGSRPGGAQRAGRDEREDAEGRERGDRDPVQPAEAHRPRSRVFDLRACAGGACAISGTEAAG
jgi:hypothetical protein